MWWEVKHQHSFLSRIAVFPWAQTCSFIKRRHIFYKINTIVICLVHFWPHSASPLSYVINKCKMHSTRYPETEAACIKLQIVLLYFFSMTAISDWYTCFNKLVLLDFSFWWAIMIKILSNDMVAHPCLSNTYCTWYEGSTRTSHIVALKAWSDVARAMPISFFWSPPSVK